LLVRRLGFELEQRLRGARVTDAGLLADGRFAIVLRDRGQPRLVAIDVFASPPLLTVETGELGILPEPGFVRVAAAALKGSILATVRARRGDRLLRLTFATRSRFGVDDAIELYVELVPRFGNLVLVKRDTVVAAGKEFSPAENQRRSVRAGQPHELPPLPGDGPGIPKLLEGAGMTGAEVLALAESDAAMREPLFVYRRDGTLLQAHVVALPGYEDAECAREDSLLDVLADLHLQMRGRGERERSQRRRDAVVKRLAERERKLRGELAAIDVRRERAASRDALRVEGEGIFAELHTKPVEERDDAKTHAASLFARYKKLGASLPHLQRRERELRAQLAAAEDLTWEAERVAPEDLDELEATVATLGGRRAPAAKPSPVRRQRRALFEVRTASGSRIVVGRSPAENAHVTFALARPDDLWFHAQGIPGAHVILSRDDRSEPPPEDIATAAALAAQHSKGKSSAKVPVDYTQRKHVRKQRNAPPGLVWYTNPKTVIAIPDGVPPKDEAVPNAQLTRRGRELRT
jgi:hypothetical protein